MLYKNIIAVIILILIYLNSNKNLMIKRLFLALCVISLASCDPSDDGDSGRTNNDFQYFPLTVSNSWDYDVSTGTNTSSETLTVATVTGSEYTLTSNPSTPTGFMSQILTGGDLKAESGKLIGNGVIGLNLQGLNNFNVPITNGVLYDQNASANSELFSTQGTNTQTIQTYDLDFNYVVKTVQQSSISQMMVNGTTYQDVIHSQLIVNLSILTEITIAGFTQQVPVLEPQDAIVVDNYWAKDIGLIRSDYELNYTLEDFSALGISLPVPQSANIESEQTLTGHTVN